MKTTNKKMTLRRAAVMLLLMVLTATTAWAFKTETPTNYTVSLINNRSFRISDGTQITAQWDATTEIVSGKTYYYWKANVSHNLANDMTIKTNADVVASSVTSEGIHTGSGYTMFTFTAPSDIAITRVTFMNGNNEVSVASHSGAGTTYTVTLYQSTAFTGFNVTFGYISGSCGTNATWTLSKQDGQYTALTISGSGAMDNYYYTTVGNDETWRTNAPWDWQDLKSVTIENGITSIGNYAFIGCRQLSSLTIGSSVTTLGAFAFNHCDALTEVTLPASVTSIGDECFRNSGSLQRVNILRTDGDLITLGSKVFNGCNKLKYIVAPTLTLALQYKTATNWNASEGKIGTEFCGYVFYATNEGGTDAYAITNEDDLRHLASAINGGSSGIATDKTFRQTGLIALSSTNFEPIGSSIYFSGTYDGGGYTISGLQVSHLDNIHYYGLFGDILHGIVKNVRLVSPSISVGNVDNSTYYGALCGMAQSSNVENCVVYNPTFEGSGGIKGAIIGYNSGSTLQNLYFCDGNCSNAIGSIYNGTSTNVGRARKVTIGSGISNVTPAINPAATNLDNGFVYIDDLYYREGLALTLTTNLSATTGYHVTYKADDKTISSLYTVNSTDGDVTLTAVLANNTYTVQFDKNHTDATGSMTPQTHTYGHSQPLSANTYSRTGYTFAGWATSANGNVVYRNQQSVSNLTATDGGTVTLYAKWTPTTYTITYNLNGGSVATPNPTSYTIETPTFTLNNPTKEGYRFTGWTGSNGNTPQTTVKIDKGSTENRTYTANYKTNHFTVGEWSYELTSASEVKVTACHSSATSVTIPTTVSYDDETFTVTAIDATAFSSCTSLLIVILESATPPILGSNAFDACTALKVIGVPSGTEGAYMAAAGWVAYAGKISATYGTCGTNVYYSYNSTVKTLHIFGTGGIPDNNDDLPWNSYKENITTVVIAHGVTSIGGYAFDGCTGLTSVTIPSSVTTIDRFAFNGCSGLTSVTIPSGVTTIGNTAFNGCTRLTSIEIPASVTTIGEYAFNGCFGLESISVAAGNTTYDSRNNCNAIIETESKKLIKGCKNTVIPDGVTTIGKYAFQGCTGLTSIEIPASVTSIGKSAFSTCINLSSVTIYAPSLTTYGSNAFSTNNSSGRKIYVFSNCVDTYKAHASEMGANENDIQPIENISLKDAADNSSRITAANGYTLNVTLQGRTLWKDGAWNTLCLPFNVTVGSGQMAGATAMTLNASESGFNSSTGVLTLNFDGVDEGSTIAAGTPFIVKWTGANVTDPVFTNVSVLSSDPTPAQSAGGDVAFTGSYSPAAIAVGNKACLFLGVSTVNGQEVSTLYYPNASNYESFHNLTGATADNYYLGVCRAYFKINLGGGLGVYPVSDPSVSGVRAFVLNFGDGSEDTGIISISKEESCRDRFLYLSAWYTLDGVKLDGKPTKKGLYIHGGRKVAIK